MNQAAGPLPGPTLSHSHLRSGSLRFLLLGAACMTLLAFGQAHAATTTVATGNFTSDAQVNMYSIVIGQTSNVTFQTTSYASGGFVPVLGLFSPTGAFIADDGGDATCSAGMTPSASTGLCNDASISAMLSAGTYTLTLSEFDNYPGLTLSTPFSEAGNGNFTEGYCSGATTPFQEIDLAPCAQRTSAFAINQTTTSATVTPEPSTLLLVLPPAVALFTRRRHRAA